MNKELSSCDTKADPRETRLLLCHPPLCQQPFDNQSLLDCALQIWHLLSSDFICSPCIVQAVHENAIGEEFRTLPQDTWYLQLLIFPKAIKACSPLVWQYLCLKNHLGCYSSLLYSACFFFVWLQIDRIYLPSADTIWSWWTNGATALLALLPRGLEGYQGQGLPSGQSRRYQPRTASGTLLYKTLRLGLWVSPPSCCTQLVLLDLLSLFRLGGTHCVLPVQEGSKEEKLLY